MAKKKLRSQKMKKASTRIEFSLLLFASRTEFSAMELELSRAVSGNTHKTQENIFLTQKRPVGISKAFSAPFSVS